MRTVINFTVQGKNQDDLKSEAVEVYRELVGDPEAELPYSATIEIRPDTVETSGAGKVVARSWEGEVTVSQPTEGGSQ